MERKTGNNEKKEDGRKQRKRKNGFKRNMKELTNEF